MKNWKIVSLLLICVFVSCNNDLAENQNEVVNLEKEKTDYLAYVEQLQKEFPGKTVYHQYNMPEVSEDVKSLFTANDSENDGEDMQLRIADLYKNHLGPWGNASGTSFSCTEPVNSSNRLMGIQVTYGSYINSIQLVWVDSYGSFTLSPIFGVSRGNTGYLALDEYDVITRIRVKHQGYINSILFESKNGVWLFGGTGGGEIGEAVDDAGFDICGVFGSYASGVSNIGKIGFYYYQKPVPFSSGY
ncbi:MAG: hypothetical protein E6772_07600 [Dysgonomonas sp.]|nr:hypothetical protein [Dysgonomonas sp.]